MKALKIATIVAFVSAAAGSTAFAEVRVTLQDGRVSIVAKDATVRQILTEWARVGQTQVLNVDKIPGAPVTLELTNVPEAEALDVLLRTISGYMAAPRAVMAANVSQFDRIVVMPTTAPPRAPVSASAAPAPAPAAMPQPQFQPQFQPQIPQQAADDDVEDERPAPNVVVPQRGAVFNQFPQPQVVSPQIAPTVVGGTTPAIPSGVFNPQAPQMAQPGFGQHVPGLEIAQQPSQGAMPIYQVPPNGQPPPAAAAPTGVAIPGMIVPAPQQPGVITAPQPPRRPGGQE